jgi:glutamine synthetase
MFYCGNGFQRNFGRELLETHTAACLHAGVALSGTNSEVMPGQAEYQVGPVNLIDSGDHMLVARFILTRVCEDKGVFVSFDPKPLAYGDWNGTGCHMNHSSKVMREDGGMEHILKAIEKLSKVHELHIEVYGAGNERRLTGKHETASISLFKYGVGNRGASIRIPTETANKGKGYFEDRRPAGNVDAYIAASALASTCYLEDKTPFNALLEHYRDWRDGKLAPEATEGH